ncbi:MAG TPA: hypothetical protein PKE13_17285 [Hyphomicrobium zavarzinii]|nr:hypothetical protein [Hyphomicrobium zavarzinii]
MLRSLVIISAVLALIFGLFPTSHGNAHAIAAAHADCHHAQPHQSADPDDHTQAPVDRDDCGKHGFGGCMDANGCRHASCDVAGVPMPAVLVARATAAGNSTLVPDDTMSGRSIPPLLDPPRRQA